ncbi:hypothetical protein L1887_14874 [Cichorium endivia]|nr:hypothetical protein L1887_14874 [Cichorium endivia]
MHVRIFDLNKLGFQKHVFTFHKNLKSEVRNTFLAQIVLNSDLFATHGCLPAQTTATATGNGGFAAVLRCFPVKQPHNSFQIRSCCLRLAFSSDLESHTRGTRLFLAALSFLSGSNRRLRAHDICLYNDHHTYGNHAQPLHFAQPRRQSVASHFQPREYDDSSPIYIPDNIDSQVEIRPQLLGILPEFRGYKQDDPYNHLYEFLAIANANNPRNTDRNIFRLRLFPFTLKDKAKYWFTSLPSNSITTWDQLKAKFLQEFYPASKTTEIRRIIQDFQQKPGEAFHEAFDRLK